MITIPTIIRVVSGGGDGIVKLWDLTAGKQMEDFTKHSGEITSLDFHPSEFLLAVGSADRTITVCVVWLAHSCIREKSPFPLME